MTHPPPHSIQVARECLDSRFSVADFWALNAEFSTSPVDDRYAGDSVYGPLTVGNCSTIPRGYRRCGSASLAKTACDGKLELYIIPVRNAETGKRITVQAWYCPDLDALADWAAAALEVAP